MIINLSEIRQYRFNKKKNSPGFREEPLPVISKYTYSDLSYVKRLLYYFINDFEDAVPDKKKNKTTR